MLDVLAKETSAGAYSTRRPLSCIRLVEILLYFLNIIARFHEMARITFLKSLFPVCSHSYQVCVPLNITADPTESHAHFSFARDSAFPEGKKIQIVLILIKTIRIP